MTASCVRNWFATNACALLLQITYQLILFNANETWPSRVLPYGFRAAASCAARFQKKNTHTRTAWAGVPTCLLHLFIQALTAVLRFLLFQWILITSMGQRQGRCPCRPYPSSTAIDFSLSTTFKSLKITAIQVWCMFAVRLWNCS